MALADHPVFACGVSPVPDDFDRVKALSVPTECRIKEAAARCHRIMAAFHDAARTPSAKMSIISEIQDIATWVEDVGMEPGEVDEHVIRAVEAALLARYGPELGPRLIRMFDEISRECRPSVII